VQFLVPILEPLGNTEITNMCPSSASSNSTLEFLVSNWQGTLAQRRDSSKGVKINAANYKIINSF